MKPVFTILFLLLTAAEVPAQQKTADMVYLKNGEQYAGEIISYQQGENLVLRRPDGEKLVINDADIARIVQGTAWLKEDREAIAPWKPVQVRTKGWYNTVSISFGLGSGSGNNSRTSRRHIEFPCGGGDNTRRSRTTDAA